MDVPGKTLGHCSVIRDPISFHFSQHCYLSYPYAFSFRMAVHGPKGRGVSFYTLVFFLRIKYY